ncbi:MAG: hypothetical protein M1825_002345 [Sarcosagium campestre]|nr:MAG: hypothetical protein M1825_002345 [Sarcosagium campestre]
MSLADLYREFLRSPSPAILSKDTSLHYIPTVTSFKGPESILKNLLAKELKKPVQEIIDIVEGETSLVVEVQTTIKFLTSGGAYLPRLDDNFIIDRTVIIPISHTVHFDSNRKISQLRLQWDQASLLKGVEVIGSRSKGWPVTDGKDQARLITSSAATSSIVLGHEDPRVGNPETTTNRRDARRDRDTEATQGPPRTSSKPPPRDYHDLFVGNESDASPPTVSNGRSFAGGKQSSSEAIAPKAGSNKNYQASRLFDTEAVPAQSPLKSSDSPSKNYQHFEFGDGNDAPEIKATESPSKKYNHFEFADAPDASSSVPVAESPSKHYDHFEFGDGSDAKGKPKIAPMRPKTSKHASQWDFEDFATPIKPATKQRSHDERHFGWSDDEADPNSPVKPKQAVKPRRDAETHFDFTDDGTPAGQKRPPTQQRGSMHNQGLGLYENHIYDENDAGSAAKAKTAQSQPQPLTQTNTNAHRKVFDSQFTMSDTSPVPKDKDAAAAAAAPRTLAADRQAAVKMMDSSWDRYEETPSPQQQQSQSQSQQSQQNKKENNTKSQQSTFKEGIKTTGDGMGGRRGAGRQWGFGDESDGEEHNKPIVPKAKPAGKGNFWDF